jgi:hypothetical protein
VKGIPVRPDGEPARKTLVLAGSYRQFAAWCMYSRVNPHARNVTFLTSLWDIRGYADFDLVYTGTWEARADLASLLHELAWYEARGAIGQMYYQRESCDIVPSVTG